MLSGSIFQRRFRKVPPCPTLTPPRIKVRTPSARTLLTHSGLVPPTVMQPALRPFERHTTAYQRDDFRTREVRSPLPEPDNPNPDRSPPIDRPANLGVNRAALGRCTAVFSQDRSHPPVIHPPGPFPLADNLRRRYLRGRRQLLLPLTTFILAGLEPSSLVHHHAVWRQGRQKLRIRDSVIC